MKRFHTYYSQVKKEDKITREFYKELSHLSKNINYSKKKKLKLFEQVVRIIKGKGWG